MTAPREGLSSAMRTLHTLNYKGPCKRTQHVGTTLPNIVGIVLADVGSRVFKRSEHVGQCCFYGNTEGSLDLIFTPNSLRNYNNVTFVRHYAWCSMNTDD